MKENVELLFKGTEINKEFFVSIKEKPYFLKMVNFLLNEHLNKTVYPPLENTFETFKHFPLKDTKVLIIGQDPYHGEGEANGLAFSVNKGIKLPPSLKNIYQEIGNEYKTKVEQDGDLSYLAKQNVLLLNVYLSVEKDKPLSHKSDFYEEFTKDVINYLNDLDRPIVFMLWGSFAKSFAKSITNKKHLIIFNHHPSPLSANKGGWFNLNQFKRANEFLENNDLSPINWIK